MGPRLPGSVVTHTSSRLADAGRVRETDGCARAGGVRSEAGAALLGERRADPRSIRWRYSRRLSTTGCFRSSAWCRRWHRARRGAANHPARSIAGGPRSSPTGIWPGPTRRCTGLLKTIPQELAGVACRHVDLDLRRRLSRRRRRSSARSNALDGEPEVAYRTRVRYVSRLAPLDLAANRQRPVAVRRGGCYVVTGGLGALGSDGRPRAARAFRGAAAAARPDPDRRAAHAMRRASARRSSSGCAPQATSCTRRSTSPTRRRFAERGGSRAASTGGRTSTGSCTSRASSRSASSTDEEPAHVLAMIRAKLSGTWALRQLVGDGPTSCFSRSPRSTDSLVASRPRPTPRRMPTSTRQRRPSGVAARRQQAWPGVFGTTLASAAGYAMKDLSRARGYLPIGTSEGSCFLAGRPARSHGPPAHRFDTGVPSHSPVRRDAGAPRASGGRDVRGECVKRSSVLRRCDVRDGFGQRHTRICVTRRRDEHVRQREARQRGAAQRPRSEQSPRSGNRSSTSRR